MPENPRKPMSISQKDARPAALKVLGFKQYAQGDVVDMLEDMLAMAKSGHIRAAAVAIHADVGNTGGGFALGNGDVAHLVCSLERIKLRILDDT
jgi:hypothetical protein